MRCSASLLFSRCFFFFRNEKSRNKKKKKKLYQACIFFFFYNAITLYPGDELTAKHKKQLSSLTFYNLVRSWLLSLPPFFFFGFQHAASLFLSLSL